MIITDSSKTLFYSSKFPWARGCLFEIYRQFGHAPSKRFSSPELDDREGGLISGSAKHVSLCHCIQTDSYTQWTFLGLIAAGA
jgi:hypothetical protein